MRLPPWPWVLSLPVLLLMLGPRPARADYPQAHGAPPAQDQALDLSAYRLPDGTLDWKRLSERFKSPHDAMKNVSLVFFFEELAQVIRSGNYERIGALFDGLASTEFFTEYGLFTVGYMGASEVFAQGIEPSMMMALKGSFVRSVVRSQVAMAAGMALPRLATGTFNGKLYAIDMAAMGLSSVAVSAALNGVTKVVKIALGSSSGMGGMAGHGAAMGAGPWGYVYMVGEMALMFYFGDKLSMWAQAQLDERAQSRQLAEASRRVIETAALKDGAAFDSALDGAGEAWALRRTRLLAPLVEGEKRERSRWRQAWGRYRGVVAADKRLQDLAAQGTDVGALMLERSADLVAEEQRNLKRTLAQDVVSGSQRRAEALEQLYRSESAGDPYVTERSGKLGFGKLSKNRLATYGQEREVLLEARQRAADDRRRARIDERLRALDETRDMDLALHHELKRAEGDALRAAQHELAGHAQGPVAPPQATGATQKLHGAAHGAAAH